MNLQEFESQRAKANLKQAVEYMKVLEWIKVALETGTYDKAAIIKEITNILKPSN